jgi:hypothetical protein
MQPLSSFPEGGVESSRAGPLVRGLPKDVLVGLILGAVGFMFTAGSYIWNDFGIRMYGGDFTFFIGVEVGLSVTEFVSLQFGLFLIFRGVLRALPRMHPWSRMGPLLILIGALTVALFGIAELLLVYSAPSSSGSGLDWLYLALMIIDLAGYLATTLGLILSLFAVARGVLSRRPAPPGVPLP